MPMYVCMCHIFYSNEETYYDIATAIEIQTREILKEREEILQRLEDIEQQQVWIKCIPVMTVHALIYRWGRENESAIQA